MPAAQAVMAVPGTDGKRVRVTASSSAVPLFTFRSSLLITAGNLPFRNPFIVSNLFLLKIQSFLGGQLIQNRLRIVSGNEASGILIVLFAPVVVVKSLAFLAVMPLRL